MLEESGFLAIFHRFSVRVGRVTFAGSGHSGRVKHPKIRKTVLFPKKKIEFKKTYNKSNSNISERIRRFKTRLGSLPEKGEIRREASEKNQQLCCCTLAQKHCNKRINRNGIKTVAWLIVLRGENDSGPAVEFKSSKRTELVKAGYRIVGNIGDQWTDLIGENVGARTFKVP
ncbi:hypothetical protein RND71_006077 [Anisodus tanguticus]|uniref:Uncharacterized protein n=1 Tax=Anisodus tanguticus TaxID=243964 RepID=A0AAE1VVY1_9SOLA|nr:hypothetical protein RND71_006077 [Anisodus tanguticus]